MVSEAELNWEGYIWSFDNFSIILQVKIEN